MWSKCYLETNKSGFDASRLVVGLDRRALCGGDSVVPLVYPVAHQWHWGVR